MLLVGCWRLLFHARIHVALDELTASGGWSPAAVRRRIQQLGPAEFEEIRMVLGQEDLLLPPRSDASIYAEFVAVYLELRYFAGSFLPRYFPGWRIWRRSTSWSGRTWMPSSLFRATRPPGAPDPKDQRLAECLARSFRGRGRARRSESSESPFTIRALASSPAEATETFRDEVPTADAQVAAAGRRWATWCGRPSIGRGPSGLRRRSSPAASARPSRWTSTG